MELSNEKPWLETKHTTIWTARPEEPLASIGDWLIWAPWVHLAWNYHYAYIIHLRPVAGLSEPYLEFEGATHEFVVAALNPNNEPKSTKGPFSPLFPPSIVQQFVSISDEEAVNRIEFLLHFVAQERMSIDSDARRLWKYLLK